MHVGTRLTLGSTPVQSTHKKFPGRSDLLPPGQKLIVCFSKWQTIANPPQKIKIICTRHVDVRGETLPCSLRNSCLGRFHEASADFTPKCTFITQRAAWQPPKSAKMPILRTGVKLLPQSTVSLCSCNPAFGAEIMVFFINLLPRKLPRDGAMAFSKANTTLIWRKWLQRLQQPVHRRLQSRWNQECVHGSAGEAAAADARSSTNLKRH